jgi:hypothetical protein
MGFSEKWPYIAPSVEFTQVGSCAIEKFIKIFFINFINRQLRGNIFGQGFFGKRLENSDPPQCHKRRSSTAKSWLWSCQEDLSDGGGEQKRRSSWHRNNPSCKISSNRAKVGPQDVLSGTQVVAAMLTLKGDPDLSRFVLTRRRRHFIYKHFGHTPINCCLRDWNLAFNLQNTKWEGGVVA